MSQRPKINWDADYVGAFRTGERLPSKPPANTMTTRTGYQPGDSSTTEYSDDNDPRSPPPTQDRRKRTRERMPRAARTRQKTASPSSAGESADAFAPAITSSVLRPRKLSNYHPQELPSPSETSSVPSRQPSKSRSAKETAVEISSAAENSSFDELEAPSFIAAVTRKAAKIGKALAIPSAVENSSFNDLDAPASTATVTRKAAKKRKAPEVPSAVEDSSSDEHETPTPTATVTKKAAKKGKAPAAKAKPSVQAAVAPSTPLEDLPKLISGIYSITPDGKHFSLEGKKRREALLQVYLSPHCIQHPSPLPSQPYHSDPSDNPNSTIWVTVADTDNVIWRVAFHPSQIWDTDLEFEWRTKNHHVERTNRMITALVMDPSAEDLSRNDDERHGTMQFHRDGTVTVWWAIENQDGGLACYRLEGKKTGGSGVRAFRKKAIDVERRWWLLDWEKVPEDLDAA